MNRHSAKMLAEMGLGDDSTPIPIMSSDGKQREVAIGVAGSNRQFGRKTPGSPASIRSNPPANWSQEIEFHRQKRHEIIRNHLKSSKIIHHSRFLELQKKPWKLPASLDLQPIPGSFPPGAPRSSAGCRRPRRARRWRRRWRARPPAVAAPAATGGPPGGPLPAWPKAMTIEWDLMYNIPMARKIIHNT